MPASALLWLSWVLTLAAFFVAHVALLLAVLRSPTLSRPWRLAALVPPVLPVAAWRAGIRRRVAVWTLLAGLYVVLRLLEGVV